MNLPPEFLPLLPAERYEFDRFAAIWRRREQGAAFAYTDGAEFEQSLLARVKAAADRAVLSPAMLAEIADWPSRYHLSPRRANLLRPLEDFLRGRKVLEVGAGCGAITRYLGEIGATVLAVEGSLARARVAAARCAGLSQVHVVAETLQELPPLPQFDVVTLIGVLEYARIFFPAAAGVDAVDAMLACARQFLRPGGVLIVGIENQLGLKYFAGYGEDHVNERMFGIEDRYAADGVVTFGRKELGQRLARAGLGAQRWLFPFPDYKLPVAVLSERGVRGDDADLGPLASASVLADAQTPPQMLFSLERAWRPVMRNGLGGELANSLLAIAGEAPVAALDACLDTVLAWHFAVERAPRFAKRVVFRALADGVVVEAETLLPQASGDEGEVRMRVGTTAFRAGELWQHELMALLNRPGWTCAQVIVWAQRWFDCLAETEVLARERPRGLDTVLPSHLLDAVPRNLLVHGERAQFIDLEWQFGDGVSLGHLCYRALVFSFLGVASVAAPAQAENLNAIHLFAQCMAAFGFGAVDARLHEWQDRERAFQLLATGVDIPRELDAIRAYRLPVRASY